MSGRERGRPRAKKQHKASPVVRYFTPSERARAEDGPLPGRVRNEGYALTMCAGCGMNADAFPSRRAFKEHQYNCHNEGSTL